MKARFFYGLFSAILLTACQSTPTVTEWVSTTFDLPWQSLPTDGLASAPAAEQTILIDATATAQTVEGFGSCFSELGWDCLSALDDEARAAIFHELYAPGVGGNFTICRMPIGSSDFALDYYSFDDVEGDFAMEQFSIDRDKRTLIPFIKGALQSNPDLKIWGSPWCPPTWMKRNKHYASRSAIALARMYGMGELTPEALEASRARGLIINDLAEDNQTLEGTDAFITDDAHFKAYALYFQKYIEAYRAEGIRIFGIMPQNEFNSDQPYPSCVWTLASLGRFMGKYLGPAMEEVGVELMYGTVERPFAYMVDSIMQNPDCARYVKTIGFQWAGKDALVYAQEHYPDLRFIQTEQECGDGKNDWTHAMHCFDLLVHYFNHGVSVYDYWNTALSENGLSRWGWTQNSLVVVDKEAHTYRYSPEYYVLKHASHYVQPGATRIQLAGDADDALCFVNPDKTAVVLLANKTDDARQVSLTLGSTTLTPTLPAQSVNTLVINHL